MGGEGRKTDLHNYFLYSKKRVRVKRLGVPTGKRGERSRGLFSFGRMRDDSFASAVILVIALLISGSLLPSTFASQASSQSYVIYSVVFTNGTQRQIALTVSESVQPSSSKGFSILTVSLHGENSNLTYSKQVNSSETLFPYLVPAIANNESLSYEAQNYSLSFSIERNGTSSVVFNGSSYELSDYSFVASISSHDNFTSQSLRGEISAFPSNLVYSVDAKINETYSIEALLLSTNLPLNAPDPSPLSSPLGEEIALAAVIAALGAAVFIGVSALTKNKSRSPSSTSSSNQGKKPPYWVD